MRTRFARIAETALAETALAEAAGVAAAFDRHRPIRVQKWSASSPASCAQALIQEGEEISLIFASLRMARCPSSCSRTRLSSSLLVSAACR